MTLWKWIGSYYVLEVVIVILAVAATWYGRRHRLRGKHTGPPSGFQQTGEVFIDPTTGIRQQVWFNPQTGERWYQTLGKD